MPRADRRLNPKTWQRITDLAEDLGKDCEIEVDGNLLTHGHTLADLVADRAQAWQPGDFAYLIRKLKDIKDLIRWCKERDVERDPRGACRIRIEILLDKKLVTFNWI